VIIYANDVIFMSISEMFFLMKYFPITLRNKMWQYSNIFLFIYPAGIYPSVRPTLFNRTVVKVLTCKRKVRQGCECMSHWV